MMPVVTASASAATPVRGSAAGTAAGAPRPEAPAVTTGGVLQPEGDLTSISCTSATFCMAVGPGPLTERWNGQQWLLTTAPLPNEGSSGALDSVSCVGHECMAVGSFDRSNVQEAYGVAWTGSKWGVEAPADPKGATSNLLTSVSCLSVSYCLAVGTTADAAVSAGLLAETWNGRRWTLAAAPAAPSGATSPSLAGVSCVTTAYCMAVGSVEESGSGTVPLAASWDGTGWTSTQVPQPGGGTGSSLASVACPSASDCTAVGQYDDTASGLSLALAEAWNGTEWAAQVTPDPAGSVELASVSCTSDGACVAAGSATPTDGSPATLIEVRDGTTWTIQDTPSTEQPAAQLEGVSCAPSAACLAVGHTDEYSGAPPSPLTELQAGTTWGIEPTPVSPSSIQSTVSAVSCAAQKSCVAVGSASNDVSGPGAFSEIWNGTTWEAVAVALPPAATTTQLSSVSCTATTACTAVGATTTSGSESQTLVEVWNGRTWTIQPTPATPDGEGAVLDQVSCASAASCMAVGGTSVPDDRASSALAEMWDGSTWAVVATPDPSGATVTTLAGVSCPTTTACKAVGTSSGGLGGPLAIAERWNGEDWALQVTPQPSPALPGAGFTAVSCSATNSCLAVGPVMAEKWNGSHWTLLTPAVPGGADATSFAATSCPAGGPCTAVGSYLDSADQQHTLAESYGAGAWAVQSTSDPTGAQHPALASVSCRSTKACQAVGGTGVNGVGPLAEGWDGSTWSIEAIPAPQSA